MAASERKRHLRAVGQSELADSLTERLAKAMTHPVRAAILDALGRQPMTPQQVSLTHSGVSLQSIAQQFRRLEELELIEVVGELSSGAQVFGIVRGSLFDQSGLESLGDAARNVTGAIAKNYTERIEQALKEATFGARGDTRFFCTTGYLDEPAWTSVIAATDALFWRSLYLQLEAVERLEASGETPIILTTGFGCFVSPRVYGDLRAVPPIKYGALGSRPSGAAETELAKALSHPLRRTIIEAMERGPISPTEVRELHPGVSLKAVLRHFARLEELNCIEQVEKRRVDGNARNRFQLRDHGWHEGSLYAALPSALRGLVDSVYASSYIERVAEAITTDTMESRQDAHLTWSGLRYDEQAWSELSPEIDDLFRYVISMYVQSEERHGFARRSLQPVGALTPVTFSLAAFESPSGAWALSGDELRLLLDQEDAPSRQTLRGYRSIISADRDQAGGSAA